ncbi:DUF4832 domain-containing protein [Reichenbachiella sp. MALMAid0571]|uniref:DUF4832 domain-containing protein n=1 Tax=Reichenbachiella sp. MALMAid0571 TaxID=3143939 RepID=UPI0032DE5579
MFKSADLCIAKTILIFISLVFSSTLFAQRSEPEVAVKVFPKEINDVLNNPGIGFTTFQRFNGDDLNEGIKWTEGFPIEYQEFDGDLTNPNHPQTTIAYFRVNWRFLEVEPGVYNWDLIDKALRTAAERGQTLMLRISPYEGTEEKNAPLWYRKIIGKEKNVKSAKWEVDAENPAYLKYFGGMIAALGQRYDGHPDLEMVDVSFVGHWGEGDGMHLLTDQTRLALINVYLDNFRKTHLIFQPLNGDAPDPGKLVKGTNIAACWSNGRNNGEGPNMRHLGWRIDCLGDINFWKEGGWSHMSDIYPQDIIKSGMSQAWKKAPVAMEICGTFLQWLGPRQYSKDTVKYIFEKALQWHISSFNAKSSAVPEEWRLLVDEWLNKMGYRYVLRKFTFPSVVRLHGQLSITSWWENKGVAPIYKDYKFSIRLKNQEKTVVLPTDADIRTWLPGDILHDEKLYIPYDMPEGTYAIEVALVSPVSYEPRVKLAIAGVNKEGWYTMGEIQVEK